MKNTSSFFAASPPMFNENNSLNKWQQLANKLKKPGMSFLNLMHELAKRSPGRIDVNDIAPRLKKLYKKGRESASIDCLSFLIPLMDNHSHQQLLEIIIPLCDPPPLHYLSDLRNLESALNCLAILITHSKNVSKERLVNVITENLRLEIQEDVAIAAYKCLINCGVPVPTSVKHYVMSALEFNLGSFNRATPHLLHYLTLLAPTLYLEEKKTFSKLLLCNREVKADASNCLIALNPPTRESKSNPKHPNPTFFKWLKQQLNSHHDTATLVEYLQILTAWASSFSPNYAGVISTINKLLLHNNQKVKNAAFDCLSTFKVLWNERWFNSLVSWLNNRYSQMPYDHILACFQELFNALVVDDLEAMIDYLQSLFKFQQAKLLTLDAIALVYPALSESRQTCIANFIIQDLFKHQFLPHNRLMTCLTAIGQNSPNVNLLALKEWALTKLGDANNDEAQCFAFRVLAHLIPFLQNTDRETVFTQLQKNLKHPQKWVRLVIWSSVANAVQLYNSDEQMILLNQISPFLEEEEPFLLRKIVKTFTQLAKVNYKNMPTELQQQIVRKLYDQYQSKIDAEAKTNIAFIQAISTLIPLLTPDKQTLLINALMQGLKSRFISVMNKTCEHLILLGQELKNPALSHLANWLQATIKGKDLSIENTSDLIPLIDCLTSFPLFSTMTPSTAISQWLVPLLNRKEKNYKIAALNCLGVIAPVLEEETRDKLSAILKNKLDNKSSYKVISSILETLHALATNPLQCTHIKWFQSNINRDTPYFSSTSLRFFQEISSELEKSDYSELISRLQEPIQGDPRFRDLDYGDGVIHIIAKLPQDFLEKAVEDLISEKKYDLIAALLKKLGPKEAKNYIPRLKKILQLPDLELSTLSGVSNCLSSIATLLDDSIYCIIDNWGQENLQVDNCRPFLDFIISYPLPITEENPQDFERWLTENRIKEGGDYTQELLTILFANPQDLPRFSLKILVGQIKSLLEFNSVGPIEDMSDETPLHYIKFLLKILSELAERLDDVLLTHWAQLLCEISNSSELIPHFTPIKDALVVYPNLNQPLIDKFFRALIELTKTNAEFIDFSPLKLLSLVEPFLNHNQRVELLEHLITKSSTYFILQKLLTRCLINLVIIDEESIEEVGRFLQKNNDSFLMNMIYKWLKTNYTVEIERQNKELIAASLS